MLDKKFGKNVLLVVISNGVKLISSVMSLFLIPLMFSQQDYGFYKLFLLYVSYVGFFHFGFIDGIYLYYAGKDYDELDKRQFKTFTKFLLYLELLIAILIFAISFIYAGPRQIILILVALNLIALNITSYYQFISQITQRFKEFAIRNIIYTTFNVTFIGLFFILKIDNYLLFLVGIVLINFILLFWYLFTYRDITFGKSTKISNEKSNILNLIKMGIPLLLSNLIVIFLSNVPKQFVEAKYPIEIYSSVFANFSFSFTLLGFASVFLTAIAIVIYPTLKQSNIDTLKKSYNNLNAIILVITFVSISAYFPSVWIINRVLPEYVESLKYFFVLAPGIAITSAISVVKHNYYKTFNMNKHYLVIGLITVGIMLLGVNLIYMFISREVIFIAMFTIVMQLLWYILTEAVMNKKISNRSFKNYLYIAIAFILFYGTILISSNVISFAIYLVSILLVTTIIYFKDLKYLLYKYIVKKL